MIWDSSPWREYLLADACALRKRAATKRITEKRSILIERSVFFAAYTMRRLDDAKKLSTTWEGSAVQCKRNPSLSRKPDFLDWHHIDKSYNLSKPAPCTMSARHFCDLIVHSYVFVECIRDDRSVEGFFITSDKKRHQALWFFSLDAVAGLMERTAADDPNTVAMTRNYEGELEVVWAGNAKPSGGWKGMLAGRFKPQES